MVQIRDKLLKFIKYVIIIITSITIISLVTNYILYSNKLTKKEEIEKRFGNANKDAYQFARFIFGIGMGLGVGARLFGIYAIYRENFIQILIYGLSLIVLIICYSIGIIKMNLFEVILHVILIVLAFIFARFVVREEPFSKEVATLPL